MNTLDLLKRIASSRLEVKADTTLKDINNVLLFPGIRGFCIGGLLPHQIEHTDRLEFAIRTRGSVADTSPAGRGKSFSAAEVVRRLNLPVMIYCPLAASKNWQDVARDWDLPLITITNYEMARSNSSDSTSKWYDMREGPCKNATVCPWITKENIQPKRLSSTDAINGKAKIRFTWKLPYKCIIIFDEEHVAKNSKTQTFSFIKGAVQAAKEEGHQLLFLTATPIEKKVNLKSIMYFLGLVSKPNMLAVKAYFKQHIGSSEMSDIHDYIYAITPNDPTRSTGCISSMPEPEMPAHVTNDVKPVTYQMTEEMTKKIAEKNKEILLLRERLRERAYDGTLGSINANRKFIEAYKVEKAEELTLAGLQGNFPMQDQDDNPVTKGFKRVAIFVNYKSTLHDLHQRLSKHMIPINGTTQLLGPYISVLHGDQQRQESDKATSAYNSGKTKILISTIKKGGVALSFHDTVGERDANGNNETLVIILPPTSATDIIQVLGRTFRTNVQSSVVQRILFTLGDAVEQSIRDNLDKKITDMMNFTTGTGANFDLYELVDKTLIPT